ncbi:hypothetical protein ACFLXA_02755 [Chloroflexota bacterium]
MPDIIEIALMGVGAMIVLMLLVGIAVVMTHVFASRNIQHLAEVSHSSLLSLHSLGINAIIASNEMLIVDEALEGHGDRKVKIRKIEAQQDKT